MHNNQPTPEQRARLAAVLKRQPQTSTDQGQLLPQTQKALELAGAERLEALVHALAQERVIVPVIVEPDASHLDTQAVIEHHQAKLYLDTNPDHSAADAGANQTSDMSITPVRTTIGPAFGIWTSLNDLKAYDPHARPMPIPTWRMALAALADVGGHLVVNPTRTGSDRAGSDHVDTGKAGSDIADTDKANADTADTDTGDTDTVGIVIPRPATAALAQRDTWLPAWKDQDLKERLNQLAGPDVAGVTIVPGEGVTTVVRVGVPITGGERPSSTVLQALNRLSRDQRLITACDRIVITPVPVRAI